MKKVAKKAAKKAKIHVKLGNKLSVMLRQAVADAQAVAKMKRYKLDMNRWHERAYESAVCSVCMAGATLVKRSNAKLSDDIDLYGGPGGALVTPATYRKLDAINAMRVGAVHMAHEKLHGISRPLTEQQIAAASRAEGIIGDGLTVTAIGDLASWATYLQAADILAEAGL